ncbi:MAG TPA: aldo/keto reductase [archaeon]|nr:aldo/keto reductase [archaeon]
MRKSKDTDSGFTRSDGSINRRDFLKTSSMAAFAAAAGIGAGFSGAFGAEERITVNGLAGTVLGRTGLKVTKVSFGGMLISEPPVLLRVIEQGIKLVHTAPGYTNGRSMEAFGQTFKTKGVREKVVFALKERPENLDACLKALNTDYVDILVPPLHSLGEINDPSIPGNFEKAKKAGKCGFMGFSCHSDMTNVLNRARELGYFDVTLMSYSNADNAEFVAAAKAANKAGIGIMTMKGLPKNIARKADGFDIDTAAALCGAMVGPKHAHTVLASMSSFQMVDNYREVLETKLGYRSRMLEDRYWAAQKGNYCSMCGTCTGVCPAGASIPRILRYRMYYKDYGLTDYARAKYAALDPDSKHLSRLDIERCESICSRRLPLGSMLEEAHSLLG